MAHSERYFHMRWRKVFTDARNTLVFGGIGHDPEAVEQYTPQSVTSFMKTYRRQYKKYGMSSSFRMVMSALLAIGGAFIALSLSPVVHSLVVTEGQEMIWKGIPNILSWFFDSDDVALYEAGRVKNIPVPVMVVAALTQIICIAGGAISIMAAHEYEDCKKDTSPNPLWAFAVLGFAGASTSAALSVLYIMIASFFIVCSIIALVIGCCVFLVMSIIWPMPEVIQFKHQIMMFSILSACAITYYLAEKAGIIK